MRPAPARPSLGYRPGLDGLRALAVLAVLLFHADVSWLPGGFLGVDVFFVLSGFLITALVAAEVDRSGRLRLGRFYAGRARRLLPGLVVVLVVVAVASAFWFSDAASQVREDLGAAAGYASNWWYVLHDTSYFEASGRPPMLQHLWSLAVEEQFYLLWPLVALALLRVGGRRLLVLGATAGALASTVWMAVLATRYGFPDLADPSRAYLGTDAHAMTLLVGAAAGALWRPGLRMPRHLLAKGRWAVDAFAVVGLAGVAGVMVTTDAWSEPLYRGGFLLVGLLTVAALPALVVPGSRVGAVLGAAPLVWVGRRSYGIYLWHWPVFVVTRPGLDVPLGPTLDLVLRVALTVLLADLSFRFVELPVRDGRMRAWLRGLTAPARPRTAWVPAAAAVVTGVLALGTLAVGDRLAAAEPASTASVLGPGAPTELSADDPAGQPGGGDGSAGAATGRSGPVGPATVPSRAARAAVRPLAVRPLPAPRPVVATGSVTVIGDSVVLGARDGLLRVLPGARLDASVGRQADEVLDRVRLLRAHRALAPVVVIHLGTNGIVTPDQLRAMLSLLTDRSRVVVVNSHVPKPWQDYADSVIARVTPTFANARVADWCAVSAGHTDYFVDDGVHLSKRGVGVFSALVSQVISER